MPMRPVVGSAGSKVFSIRKMVDKMLQPFLHEFPTCCNNSTQVVRRFTKIIKDAKPKLTPTTKSHLVAADARSMRASMLKEEVLESVEKLLKEPFMEVDSNFPTEDLLKTIEIILENNVFQFNDAFWKQLTGTAMGTPAACVLATFYFTHHELFTLLPMFAK